VTIYNEFDGFAAAWLGQLIQAGHIAQGTVDARDIRQLQPADLVGHRQVHLFAGIGCWSAALRLAGWPDDRPVWTASCPCQPFSSAGKRKGIDDSRHLWPEAFRLIRACRPPVVMGEQVASKDGLAWLDTVWSDLESEGYSCRACDTCAAGFGAPHIRQRLYWVADAVPAGRAERRAVAGDRQVAGGCGADGMEDSELPTGSRQQQLGREGVREQVTTRSSRGGMANGLGCDSRDAGMLQERGSVAGGGMADPEGRSWRVPVRERGQDEEVSQPRGRGEALRPMTTNGLWRDPDWLLCRDAKWRPVKSGSQPLAHAGAFRNRVAELRGAGNAINVAQAAEFIAAVMPELAAIEAALDKETTNAPLR